MKKKPLIVSNLIIMLVIMLGFAGIAYKNVNNHRTLADESISNVVSLAETDVIKTIENQMYKPLIVSQTMASDFFLRNWIANETYHGNDEDYTNELCGYLKKYKKEYNYNTVFFVSSATGKYYYQDGLNKVISKDDEHDVWYYNFVNSGNKYDLQIDTDQRNNNRITLFVNYRVTDDNGKTLGVIGVGLQNDEFQKVIDGYDGKYDLSVYIVNDGAADNSFHNQSDSFISRKALDRIIGTTNSIGMVQNTAPTITWSTNDESRKCIVYEYEDTLKWYIVVVKETETSTQMLLDFILSNLVTILLTLFACMGVTSVVLYKYSGLLFKMENTDELTGLLNRKLLRKEYGKLEGQRKNKGKNSVLFMIDIDEFKKINDTRGHLFGNMILSAIGKEIRGIVQDSGVVARWGGDEFLGILLLTNEEVEDRISKLMEKCKECGDEVDWTITISTGLYTLDKDESIEQALEKVDKALYKAKAGGRNQFAWGSKTE